MKTLYALEVRFMNGTVTMDTEVTLYESEELANKVKAVVEGKNGPSSVWCSVRKVNLYESEKEVPILND